MTGKRRPIPPERLFFAPRPPIRTQWPAIFFLMLSITLGHAVLTKPGYVGPFAGAVAMLAAGIYVSWRRRWPWLGPALRVDAKGLVVNPDSRQPASLAWSEVAGILDDPSDHSIVFDPHDSAQRVRHLRIMRRGPAVPRDVCTSDGVYFVDVIEDYWRLPKNGRNDR